MTNPKHHGPNCAGLCEGQAYNSRIKELEGDNERLRAALQDIAEPIAAMRRDLEEGYRLDCGMANVIASDPMHYRMAARAALAKAKGEQS